VVKIIFRSVDQLGRGDIVGRAVIVYA